MAVCHHRVQDAINDSKITVEPCQEPEQTDNVLIRQYITLKIANTSVKWE